MKKLKRKQNVRKEKNNRMQKTIKNRLKMINKDGYLSDEERETVHKKEKRSRRNQMEEPEYKI